MPRSLFSACRNRNLRVCPELPLKRARDAAGNTTKQQAVRGRVRHDTGRGGQGTAIRRRALGFDVVIILVY